MARTPAGVHASKRVAKKTEPRPVGRPTKYEPRFCEMVIKAGKQGYSLGAFAGMIGVSRPTIDAWAKEHPEFLGACNVSKATAALAKLERVG